MPREAEGVKVKRVGGNGTKELKLHLTTSEVSEALQVIQDMMTRLGISVKERAYVVLSLSDKGDPDEQIKSFKFKLLPGQKNPWNYGVSLSFGKAEILDSSQTREGMTHQHMELVDICDQFWAIDSTRPNHHPLKAEVLGVSYYWLQRIVGERRKIVSGEKVREPGIFQNGAPVTIEKE